MLYRGLIAPIALIAVFACALTFDVPLASAADVDDLEDQYEDASNQKSPARMKRVIRQFADVNTEDAAEFLLDILAEDQKNRKRNRPGLPGNVRETVIETLGRFTDVPSVALIGEMALGLDSKREPTLALDQFEFFKALAAMRDVEPADKTLNAALADEANPFVKVAAVEAIRQERAGRFTKGVSAILREENPDWGRKWLIVPLNVMACLEEIVEPTDTDAVIEVVESVIAWEEFQNSNHERVRYFGGRMLNELTDETADMQSIHFWKWWVAQMKTQGELDGSDRPKEGESRTAARERQPVVFDTAPVGRKIVFVIDVSLSMEDPLKISLEEIEERKERRGPVTGHGRHDDDSEDDEEEAEDDNPLRQLPWEEISKKIHLAREELARSLASLEGDREFAIVVYSTEVNVITDGWVKATARNCAMWAARAKELEPEAMTNIHGALTRAFKVHDKGIDCDHPSVNEDCILTGADTILFLTDGWASWDDQSSRRVTDKRNKEKDAVGDGPFIYAEDILPDILRLNLFRKVVINTVGIGNHDGKLMADLARRTGGTYVDWGFSE